MTYKENLALIVTIFLSTIYVNAQGIKFERGLRWEQIKAKAKAENKMIFMDCYATWCLPCREMSAQTFSQLEVGEAINNSFISVKVQMDTSKLDNDAIKKWYGDAKELRMKYVVNSFPTILYFSSNGDLVHRTIGLRNAAQLIMDSYDARDPNKQYYTLLNNGFILEDDNETELKGLARMAMSLGDLDAANLLSNRYIDKLLNRSTYQVDDILFLGEFVKKSQDNAFKIILDQYNYLGKIPQGAQALFNVKNIIFKEEMLPLLYDDKLMPIATTSAQRDTLEKNIVHKYGEIGQEAFWITMPRYFQILKDTQSFVILKNQIRNKNPGFLSNFIISGDSWFVFENSKDQNDLKAALNWIEKVVKEEPQNARAIDTYANLYYKLGYKSKAIELQKRAVLLDPNDQDLKETFNKMEKGLKTWTE